MAKKSSPTKGRNGSAGGPRNGVPSPASGAEPSQRSRSNGAPSSSQRTNGGGGQPAAKVVETITPFTASKISTSYAASRPQSSSKPLTPGTPKSADFIFGKLNYQVMIGGILVIALGFYLMSGTTDIMSPTKIVLAPIVVLLGFAIEFVAIFINPRKTHLAKK